MLAGAFEGQVSRLILAIRPAALEGQVSSSEALRLWVQFTQARADCFKWS